jgi:thioredoxin-like negative regulator of GroEL
MAKQVIKFWAGFCGPCKVYAPVFEKVKQQLQHEAEFLEVDVENDPHNISGQYGIKSIPHTVVLQDGVEIHSQPGRLSQEQLVALILN